MRKVCGSVLTGLLAVALASPGSSQKTQATNSNQKATITVDARRTLNRVSPWLAGSCVEDVNHEIYGGLYDQKVFGESFEEPLPSPRFKGWKAFGGEWQTDGTSLTVSPDEGSKQVSELPSLSDVTINAEIKFPDRGQGDDSNAGLLFRVSNPGIGIDAFNGYEISLNPNSQRLILGKHRQNFQLLQSVAVVFNPQEWTRLHVEAVGARIRIFVGEGTVPALEFSDPSEPLLSGTFGLRTWKANASFRQVSVQTAGEPLRLVETGTIATPFTPVSAQWDAVQNGSSSGRFSRDNDHPYNGLWSQKIERGFGTGAFGVANQGLNRWGIVVERGQRLGGRLYLRGQNLKGAVTVALQSADGTRTYASQQITQVSGDWARYPISLTPDDTDQHVRLTVTIDQPGTLWVDQVTLTGTGSAQFKGLPVRADIAGMMQQQDIKFLRYGGTMINAPAYRWKNMLGDPDKRPPYRGHWYPYSTNAFGIEEFLCFCEAANMKSTFAINIEETTQDAADMVEYLNGAVTTPWGKRRAENGHPKPYSVKWIEIGNEEVLDSDNAAEYDHYIERFNVLLAAMRAKDSKLQFICSAWWRPESRNVERVYKALHDKAAYWDLHVWSDDARAGTGIDRDLATMKSLFQQWVPGSTMKCMILEENGGLHNQQRALGHATALNAIRRHGDFVLASCPANALQPLGQNDNGWDQGQIFFTPDRVWGMPPFYSAQMANQNHQSQLIGCTVAGNLDVTATRSDDGRSLVLHVVNTTSEPITSTISVEGMQQIQRRGQKWALTGELNAANTPSDLRVKSIESVITDAGPQFDNNFPAHSYSVLHIKGRSQ
jgi:alpha-L-arabinofuranosidase